MVGSGVPVQTIVSFYARQWMRVAPPPFPVISIWAQRVPRFCVSKDRAKGWSVHSYDFQHPSKLVNLGRLSHRKYWMGLQETNPIHRFAAYRPDKLIHLTYRIQIPSQQSAHSRISPSMSLIFPYLKLIKGEHQKRIYSAMRTLNYWIFRHLVRINVVEAMMSGGSGPRSSVKGLLRYCLN